MLARESLSPYVPAGDRGERMRASSPIAAPRRIEALAYILERIQRSGTCPSYGEIGKALRPQVDPSRARQLVNQLVKLGVIERPPASRRGIRIRDLQRCREMINAALGQQGWTQSKALGDLEQASTFEHLPLLPLIELPPGPH
jgi:SOS-response transcriptional repressor LexA